MLSSHFTWHTSSSSTQIDKGPSIVLGVPVADGGERFCFVASILCARLPRVLIFLRSFLRCRAESLLSLHVNSPNPVKDQEEALNFVGIGMLGNN